MDTIHELIGTYMENEDKSVLPKILEQLKTTEKLWTVLVRVTNNFYLGVEQDRASAYLFTDREYADNFAREVKWGGIQAKYLEVKPEQRITFFNDLVRSGFDVVTIDKGEDMVSLSLFGIIERGAESDDTILNPTLIRAANQFYQEIARKHAIKPMQDLLCREIYKGRYLVPVAAASDTEGRQLIENTGKEIYAVLNAPESKKFLPVFTDWSEFAKYDKQKKCDAVAVSFGDFKKLIRKVDAIALNPFGFNLIIDQEKLDSIEKLNAEQGEKIISLKDRR